MEIKACCKINLGLHILRRREDGFHDIETAMIAVRGLFDRVSVRSLAFVPATPPPYFAPPEVTAFSALDATGEPLDCPPEENLCMRALRLLQARFGIGEAVVRLHKTVPSGAGLGGGSSDAAATLLAANQEFTLDLSLAELENLAAKLGSDTAFFVRALAGKSTPSGAAVSATSSAVSSATGTAVSAADAALGAQICTGRGEILAPLELDLAGRWLAILKPAGVHVSTAEAYSAVDSAGLATRSRERKTPLAELLRRPIDEWKSLIVNDFEPSIFARYPIVGELKKSLCDAGAVYASMSGSGSAVFGIFDAKPRLPHTANSLIFSYLERL